MKKPTGKYAAEPLFGKPFKVGSIVRRARQYRWCVCHLPESVNRRPCADCRGEFKITKIKQEPSSSGFTVSVRGVKSKKRIAGMCSSYFAARGTQEKRDAE